MTQASEPTPKAIDLEATKLVAIMIESLADAYLRAILQKWEYNPDQPRDADGRWTSEGDSPNPAGTQPVATTEDDTGDEFRVPGGGRVQIANDPSNQNPHDDQYDPNTERLAIARQGHPGHVTESVARGIEGMADGIVHIVTIRVPHTLPEAPEAAGETRVNGHRVRPDRNDPDPNHPRGLFRPGPVLSHGEALTDDERHLRPVLRAMRQIANVHELMATDGPLMQQVDAADTFRARSDRFRQLKHYLHDVILWSAQQAAAGRAVASWPDDHTVTRPAWLRPPEVRQGGNFAIAWADFTDQLWGQTHQDHLTPQRVAGGLNISIQARRYRADDPHRPD